MRTLAKGQERRLEGIATRLIQPLVGYISLGNIRNEDICQQLGDEWIMYKTRYIELIGYKL